MITQFKFKSSQNKQNRAGLLSAIQTFQITPIKLLEFRFIVFISIKPEFDSFPIETHNKDFPPFRPLDKKSSFI